MTDIHEIIERIAQETFPERETIELPAPPEDSVEDEQAESADEAEPLDAKPSEDPHALQTPIPDREQPTAETATIPVTPAIETQEFSEFEPPIPDREQPDPEEQAVVFGEDDIDQSLAPFNAPHHSPESYDSVRLPTSPDERRDTPVMPQSDPDERLALHNRRKTEETSFEFPELDERQPVRQSVRVNQHGEAEPVSSREVRRTSHASVHHQINITLTQSPEVAEQIARELQPLIHEIQEEVLAATRDIVTRELVLLDRRHVQ